MNGETIFKYLLYIFAVLKLTAVRRDRSKKLSAIQSRKNKLQNLQTDLDDISNRDFTFEALRCIHDTFSAGLLVWLIIKIADLF